MGLMGHEEGSSRVIQPFEYLRDDYSLSNEVYLVLGEETKGIQSEVASTVQHMLQIGVRLVRVRSLLPRGAWFSWLQHEFSWNKRTAERWISVVKKLEEYDMLEGFLSGEYGASKSALYELATDRVTDQMRRDAFSAVMGGEYLTYHSIAVMTQPLYDLTESASMASRSPEAVQQALTGSGGAVDPDMIPLLEVLNSESPDTMRSVIASGMIDSVSDSHDDQIPLTEARPADLTSLLNRLRGEEVQVKFAERQSEFTVVRMRISLPIDTDEIGSVSINYFRPDALRKRLPKDISNEMVGDYPNQFFYSTMWVDDEYTWAEFALPASALLISFVE